ncbi:MAG: TIGR03790 family protein [Planctomycetes bacterium]|nr:TIGR03790 family protein [Planctomycetota bacterium]
MLALLLAVAAAPAWALEPAEIVVVVNSAQGESVALGRFYCAERGVPQDNIVALDLPTDATISADDYIERLRDPLRKAIADKGLSDRVRCLLTVRGVPYRLAAGRPPREIEAILAWCDQAVGNARRRVARNLMLLETVGAGIPAGVTAQADPEDLQALFGTLPTSPSEAPEMADLIARFGPAVRQKAAEVRDLPDPALRSVAARQLVGLYLDTFGLIAWPAAVEAVGADGPPVPADYLRRQDKATREVVRLMNIARPDGRIFGEVERHLQVRGGAEDVHRTLTEMAARTANRPGDSRAAVDSELSLLFWDDYVREGHVPNCLMWMHDAQRPQFERLHGPVLMVSRLDGPTVASVMRMVRDAITAEGQGLGGTCYVDFAAAAAPVRAYEKAMAELVRLLQTSTSVPVVTDTSLAPFGPGKCPQAALYVGWQSADMYIESFDWQTGAVGYHVAPTEALDLRNGDSPRWVPRMLASGVVATLGAADEPGTTAFPSPAAFYALLLTGRMTVAEAYWRTTPAASWRVMLLADPLYCPFRNAPQPLQLTGGLLPEAQP